LGAATIHRLVAFSGFSAPQAVNWVDTREFFTIDVAAGEDYAKAKNAEIARKIQSTKSPVEKMMLKVNQAHIKTWFGV
jgi:hypothetical protein